MTAPKEYLLVYTRAFERHMKSVDAKHHSLIRDAIENQLRNQAEVKTRNRKPLKKKICFEAEWELRFGPQNRFRVFYKVEDRDVVVLAFGEKDGNRLFIDGEEVEA